MEPDFLSKLHYELHHTFRIIIIKKGIYKEDAPKLMRAPPNFNSR